jgi:hypothetical protein
LSSATAISQSSTAATSPPRLSTPAQQRVGPHGSRSSRDIETFETELYTLVPDAERPDGGFYLVALTRYRADLGGGLTGTVMREGAAAGPKAP